VKYFCNVRNVNPYIQDIEIINTFRDGISNLKTVEEITMKKLKTVVGLFAITNICIEISKARARLLESRGKGSSKKKDDQEINTNGRGDRKDHGYHGKQSSNQKERRPFQRPDDVEKWCEIHRTARHDLEESKTFLDRKKIHPPVAPAPQEAQRVDQR
jgi:hypothetical protein